MQALLCNFFFTTVKPSHRTLCIRIALIVQSPKMKDWLLGVYRKVLKLNGANELHSRAGQAVERATTTLRRRRGRSANKQERGEGNKEIKWKGSKQCNVGTWRKEVTAKAFAPAAFLCICYAPSVHPRLHEVLIAIVWLFGLPSGKQLSCCRAQELAAPTEHLTWRRKSHVLKEVD